MFRSYDGIEMADDKRLKVKPSVVDRKLRTKTSDRCRICGVEIDGEQPCIVCRQRVLQ